MNSIEGFLLLHKPSGITSFDCVYKVRKLIGRHHKAGHTATLDAFASGLLILAISRSATRHVQKLMELDKKYVATAKFGQLTDTLDRTGAVIEEIDLPPIAAPAIKKVMAELGSGYLQTPPIFSALQYEGRRLSHMARCGEFSMIQMQEIASAKQRAIVIHALTLIDLTLPYFSFTAHVSHGTYIRSMANDIAKRLGSCATTYTLERTAIGPFVLDQAAQLEELVCADDVVERLISVAKMLETRCVQNPARPSFDTISRKT